MINYFTRFTKEKKNRTNTSLPSETSHTLFPCSSTELLPVKKGAIFVNIYNTTIITKGPALHIYISTLYHR